MDVQHKAAPLLRGLMYNGKTAPLVQMVSEEDDTAPDSGEAVLKIKDRGFSELDEDKLVEELTAAWKAAGGAEVVPEKGEEASASGPVRIEVEGVGQYRVYYPEGVSINSPVAGKAAVVTGGAQGFGASLVQQLAARGAVVVIVDLNLEGAEKMAQSINEQYTGRGSQKAAYALQVDVSKEESVAAMAEEVVKRTGGVDLYLSNAGVLKAGSVKELKYSDFEFVSRVNYFGYFLGTKHVSPVMALQNKAAEAAGSGPMFSDIIQINSKSGLSGSNKNGAYAGGKFGGIGLTQSFALELISDNIKVNSICPGNFFEGPLWSDPERGLFVQYLRAGKVPGAKSIEDVKHFYEQKVPMKRGCTGPDVYKALEYVVDQVYETGQAVPVTGGQVMLH
ncbi:MAG: SDR family NAD(P)-dependent oxidoreductase [Spirochaetales bacterium]|nr:SDR family NAD(P)-dependent oxidoreductase [Spirochaetales bacterium]MCF7937426.1 SDR family NAD(P)-dependent oxidoreductase [Spirochaetales bacterium]